MCTDIDVAVTNEMMARGTEWWRCWKVYGYQRTTWARAPRERLVARFYPDSKGGTVKMPGWVGAEDAETPWADRKGSERRCGGAVRRAIHTYRSRAIAAEEAEDEGGLVVPVLGSRGDLIGANGEEAAFRRVAITTAAWARAMRQGRKLLRRERG